MPTMPLPPNLFTDLAYPEAPPYPTTVLFPDREAYTEARDRRNTFDKQPHILLSLDDRNIDVYIRLNGGLDRIGRLEYKVTLRAWRVLYAWSQSDWLGNLGGEDSPTASHGLQRLLNKACEAVPLYSQLPIFQKTGY